MLFGDKAFLRYNLSADLRNGYYSLIAPLPALFILSYLLLFVNGEALKNNLIFCLKCVIIKQYAINTKKKCVKNAKTEEKQCLNRIFIMTCRRSL